MDIRIMPNISNSALYIITINSVKEIALLICKIHHLSMNCVFNSNILLFRTVLKKMAQFVARIQCCL